MRHLPGRAPLALALILFPVAAACDAFDSDRSTPNEEESENAQNGEGEDEGEGFVPLPEFAQGGEASSLRLVEARWGRRVDLWALDEASGERRPWLEGLVVAADLAGLAGAMTRDVSLATGRERLVVPHVAGSGAALEVVRVLEQGLRELDGAQLPANAALSLRFDDLLDAARLSAGVALTLDGAPLAPARLELDRAHGVSIGGAHHSARVVLELDPRGMAGGSLELDLDHVTNLRGRGLAAPQVRTATVDEASMLDNGVPPAVVGRLDGQVTSVLAGAPGFFQIEFQFDATACAFAPGIGDVIETAAHAVEVIAPGAPPQGASTGRLRVQLVLGDPLTFAPGQAQLRAPWDSELGAPPACFVRFSPPAGAPPARDVDTHASVLIEFSEPMLAGSVQSTGTWTLAHTTGGDPLKQLVPATIGEIAQYPGFQMVPLLPLRHRQGVSERYVLTLVDGPNGVRDLLGTPLEQPLGEVELSLEAAQPSVESDGLTFTFDALDEDGDQLPDLRGQLLFDPIEGMVTGRPVQRFSSVVDTSQPLVSAMNVTPIGVQNPLNPLGSRQMSVWRHVDLGLGLLDEEHHNLDVEGLHWAPFQAVVAVQFSEFRMAFAHSAFLPDEVVDAFLLPQFRFSGLGATFADNVLDALSVVHDKAQGYMVSPADSFVSATGTLLHPWPLNQNVSPSQYAYWTWRDTGVVEVGGDPNSPGADPLRLQQVTGNQDLIGFYPGGEVPTIGQPLLSEFRTYPDAGALGLNQFKTSFALNSSYKPTFRAFSGGGFDTQGQPNIVDPDNEPVATGGYTASGFKTGPIDNVVGWGQVDFVTRVSRAHTRWVDTGAARDFLAGAVLEPGLFPAPPGTQIRLAFRGASSVGAAAGTPWLDAGQYDPYGDGYTQTQLDTIFGAGVKTAFDVVEFPVDDDPSWSDSLDDLDGARWVQVRLTFVANAQLGGQPLTAGFSLAWQ